MAISKQKCLVAMAASILLLLNISYIFNFHLSATPSEGDTRFLELSHGDVGLRGSSSSSSSSLSSSPPAVKYWPSLPSFLPWNFRPKLPSSSCEAYFGNGFTQHIPVFPRKPIALSSLPQMDEKLYPYKSRVSLMDSDKPSLQCFYSETLHTSVCEGRKIVMHPGRIHMSVGGEALESVVGRTEADELPSFSPGAFEIVVPADKVSDWRISEELLDVILPQGQIHDHRLRSLFSSLRTANSADIECSQEKESTLIITRYEYANLFHTATDWYSAYVVSRVLGLPHRPKVVLVDGHCQSPMDDGWEAMFENVKYAKSFSGSVCFDHVIFTPLGYETALFKGLNFGIPCKGCSAGELKRAHDDTKTARLREFGEMFKAALEVSDRQNSNDINILFIRRENYLAHPRHNGQPETRLRNEQELFNSMEKWARSESRKYRSQRQKSIHIINGTLAHMKMKEQVQAVNDASIIIGVHGAGLTHIMFARMGTIVVELLSPLFPRPHYSHISQWMGLEYYSITMRSTTVDCQEVLKLLSTILEGLV